MFLSLFLVSAACLVLTTILIMIFPGIVLWLPNTMK